MDGSFSHFWRDAYLHLVQPRPRQEIERLKAYIAELEAEIERLKEELAKKPTVLTSPLNHLAGGRKVCSY